MKQSSNPDTLLAQALALHQAGNTLAATPLYEKILRRHPQHPEALHLLGLCALQAGNPTKAKRLIEQAIAISPTPAYYNNLAKVLQNQGQIAAALDPLRHSLTLDPNQPATAFQLALWLQDTGGLAEAEQIYRGLAATFPDQPDTCMNLGNTLLDQHRPQEARPWIEKALALKPQDAVVAYNHGRLMLALGEVEQALASLNRAITLNPHIADFYNALGSLYQQTARYPEAIAAYQQALARNPGLVAVYNNLGTCFQEHRQPEQARAYYVKALEQAPQFAEARINLGNLLREQGELHSADAEYTQALHIPGVHFRRALMLPPIYTDSADVAQWRTRYSQALDVLEAEPPKLQDPYQEIQMTNFYLPYQGLADRALQEQLNRVLRLACPSLAWEAPQLGSGNKRLRIGFVSRHFRQHTIAHLFRHLLRLLPRDSFEVVACLVDPQSDAVSEAIKADADRWIALPLQLGRAREALADLRADILFYTDIGMEPFTYFLTFARLAPVQAVTWGHPITTGSPVMDYFFSSQALETEGAQAHYTERLVTMDRLLSWYAEPQRPDPLPTREQLGLPTDHNLYVCPQSLFKLHPDYDAYLHGILSGDPKGEIVLLAGQQAHWQNLLQARFQRTLPGLSERIRYVSRLSRSEYWGLLAQADVMLDPIHFVGGNSSYEGFAMGAAIVTQPSPWLKGRITAAQYQQMGLSQGICADRESYVQQALRWGTDPEARHAWQTHIVERRSALFHDHSAVSEFAAALLNCWESR
jgi:protein O-GlcNAc transferase